MTLKKLAYVLLFSSTAVLSACNTEDDSNNTTDTAPNNDESGSVTPSNTTPLETLALHNPVPQFLTTECGTLFPTDGASSTDPLASTPMMVGQIYSGRVDPDSLASQSHYWNISLAPGFYHVILESARLDKKYSNLGLNLSDTSNGSASFGDIISGNEIDFRARTYAFIEIEHESVLELEVDSKFAAEDYNLALFENGSSVPTPYLSDCPVVESLAVASSTSVELGDKDNNEIYDQWYTIDADATDYLATVDAARIDGANKNILYSLYAFDAFAQKSREDELIRANDIGATSQNTAEWRLSESVPRWIRIVNRHDPMIATILIEEE